MVLNNTQKAEKKTLKNDLRHVIPMPFDETRLKKFTVCNKNFGCLGKSQRQKDTQ